MFAINIQCRRHVKPTCKRTVAVTSGKLSQQQWMQETSSVFLQTDQGDHFLWEPQDMFIFVPPRCLRSHLWEKLIFESRTLRFLGCMSVWLPSQSVGSWRAGWSERQSPKKLNCFMTNQLLHFTNKHTFVVAGPHICNRCCRTWNILNFSAQPLFSMNNIWSPGCACSPAPWARPAVSSKAVGTACLPTSTAPNHT